MWARHSLLVFFFCASAQGAARQLVGELLSSPFVDIGRSERAARAGPWMGCAPPADNPRMPSMPKEPEAFAEQVATMLRRLQPEYAVEITGPRELLVDGRRLDLENLCRLVNHDPDRGQEIVEHYLDQLF